MSADHFSKTPGFTGTKLYCSTHEAYMPTGYRLDGVKGHPAIFEPVVNMVYQGDKPPLPGAS